MPRPSPELSTSRGSNWSPLLLLLLILLVSLATTGCNSLTVRAPEFNLPPIPPQLMEACPPLDPLPDGKMATLYLALLQDAALYQQCSRRQAALAAVVAYQQEVRAEYQRTLSQQSKPWYQFW